MAQAKNKTSVKKNNMVSKNLNKKPHNTKKKIVVADEVKKEIKEVELIKKPTKKKTVKNNIKNNNLSIEKKVLTKDEILKEKKERNRKKYESKQKKIQDTKKIKVKKKVEIPDEVKDKKKKKLSKEEKLVKKAKKKETATKILEKERKEKRKFNHKSIHLTQTFANIKDKGVNKINTVKEKANDKNIPVGKTEEEKKKRFKRIIKEAIVYAIILTIINMLCVLIFDYFNFLRLFDVKALNIVVTIIVSLIFNFFIAFMIDYFATEIWLRKKRKKEVDDIDGNNRINEKKHRKNIEEKE